MSEKNFSSSVIPNRRTATAVHRQLLDVKSPLLILGRFYSEMLARRMWDSQKAMATELGVSPFKVSRTVAAARLPAEVQALFTEKRLAFRNVQSLNTLLDQFGGAELARRAAGIAPSTPVNDIFAILTTGKKAPRRRIRVSIAPDAKYLRIEVPDMALVAPRLAELEELLNVVLAGRP